jgi:predicted dehydrogenase
MKQNSLSMVNVGIIGYGYWGPNLLRNFAAQAEGKVMAVADPRSERLQGISKSYPAIETTTSPESIVTDKRIDAVVIATPVFTHYKLAKMALENGKHVLLEKPMTSSAVEARELIEIAERKRLTLMVDHTFLYTGAVQKIKEIIDSEGLGLLQYFDSIRINLGLFQPDINVLWDLAPHDISILSHLVSALPVSVNATGISHTRNGIENVAYLTVNYQSDFIAHFNCSWTSPVKVRQTLIGGDKKMIVYNDLEQTEKVRIYDTGFKYRSEEERTHILVEYRTGDIYIPKLSTQEALSGVAADFIKCISLSKEPVANAKLGLKVVQILEASQESIKNEGKETKIING